jgi:hypothetical protein
MSDIENSVTTAAESVGPAVLAGVEKAKSAVDSADALDPPAPPAPAPGGPHKLMCPRHGEITNPITLPHSHKLFCPLCVEEFFERESVHLLERVHVIDDPELKAE